MIFSALFLPRAFLSACMILFIAVCFFRGEIKQQFSNFFQSPLLWGMSILFLLPLISGLWSEDQDEWLKTIRIKLPLFFLPLAFAGLSFFKKEDWERTGIVLVILVVAGTMWSMAHYFSQMTEVHAGYLRSVIIKTPLENDHVRFSWLVNIAIITAMWIGLQKRKQSPFLTSTIFAAAIWLIIFLHILAARTGLLCFYVCVVITALWLVFTKAKRIFAIAMLLIVAALPFIAYKTLPTFQNRVKYFLYDLPYFTKANYLEGGNDAMRIISVKAGWNIMNNHPLAGVGFGDVQSKTNEWYNANYPQMKNADKILPSSEWLIYGAGSGWPGLIIFSLIMIIPFILKNIKNYLPWYLICTSTALMFLFDIGLEVQFGVFLYSFVLLWWWRWMTIEM